MISSDDATFTFTFYSYSVPGWTEKLQTMRVRENFSFYVIEYNATLRRIMYMSITKVIPISAASKWQRFRLCAKQSKHLFNFFNEWQLQ